MQIIIDANVVIAMLIKPGKPVDLFFKEELEIFAPELLFEELERNKKEIIKKSRLTKKEFDWLLIILRRKIIIVPEEEFLKYREKAEEICPDPKDIVYFALALLLKCSIWTNEKKLKEQDNVKVYSTHELMKLFGV